MARDCHQSQLDVVLDAVGDYRRRRAIAHMENSDENVFHLDDIAEVIAIHDTEPSEDTEDEEGRLRVDLHHRHFPKLDEAGLIDYDSRNRDVRYRGTEDSNPTDVSQILNYVMETPDNITG